MGICCDGELLWWGVVVMGVVVVGSCCDWELL